MKLYGLLVVQNESDVIADLLSFLKTINIYERIFFYDLGSTDDTFEKALSFKEILHDPQVLKEPYTEKLRFDLLDQHRNFYEPGDWIAIIDADEFYVDDPLELIRLAENEDATFIQTYQINVMFTDVDLEDSERRDVPVHERLKYYLINYSEERFFKYSPDAGLFSRSKPFSRRLLNRHYQYRSPSQIRKRIETRLENRKRTANIRGRHEWPQIFSTDWRDYVIPHKILHKYDGGEFQFGRPKGVRWKDYYSKDPFSAILPQVAEVFMKERAATNGSKQLQQSGPNGEVFEVGKVTFENCFGVYAWNDLRNDFESHQWAESADGLLILVRYYLGLFRRFLLGKWYLAKAQMKNRAWNISTTLKRLIGGKSIGVISADPNPIKILDNSGVGVTTVKWKTIRSRTIEIHIDAPDGARFHEAGPSGMKPTENWVSDDTVFWLQDVTDGLPLTLAHTIARTNVKVRKGKRITI